MEPGVEAALSRLYGELQGILGGDLSLYLYGSAVLDDFRLGWSDIDLLCVAPRIPDEALERLVPLRQTLLEEEPDNPYYRSFEGLLALTGAEQPGAYLNGEEQPYAVSLRLVCAQKRYGAPAIYMGGLLVLLSLIPAGKKGAAGHA